MIQKVRYMVGRKTFKPIFVIGTGRSGTHWIGYSIAEHPEIHATIEAEPMFQWSTTMALNPQSEQQLLPKLIKIYKQKILWVLSQTNKIKLVQNFLGFFQISLIYISFF